MNGQIYDFEAAFGTLFIECLSNGRRRVSEDDRPPWISQTFSLLGGCFHRFGIPFTEIVEGCLLGEAHDLAFLVNAVGECTLVGADEMPERDGLCC